jgi:succinate-acetate transporter protein
MEAANIGPREADVAPAAEPAAGRAGGWTPADPGPLGLAGFAGTTFVLSLVNTGLVGTHAAPGGGLLPMIAALALAYGGISQLIAGIWEFRTGNTFGAVAFCSYGAFWISFFVLVQYDAKLIPGGSVGAGLGLYLWAWALFTAFMTLCSFAAPRAISAVFVCLTITFILLAIGNSGSTSGMVHAGGYAGIVTALVALYAAAGLIMKDVYGRWVLPIGAPE